MVGERKLEVGCEWSCRRYC